MGNRSSDIIFHTAGGRVPLSGLRRAAELALEHGNGFLSVGGRQELILGDIQFESRARVRRELSDLPFEHPLQHPNIVTTRPIAGRAGRTPWLSEGAYESVLCRFVTKPTIPVNLSDPRQGVLPLYTSQLNFIASDEPGYWHVSFNLRGQLRPIIFTMAVHGDGVAAATFALQHALLRDQAPDPPALQRTLVENLGGLLRELPQIAITRHGEVRPIEGFEFDAPSDTYTLGIPTPTQPLSGAFLVDLDLAARGLSIATVGLTPWRSLLVHGIPTSARADFERLLLRHRVSVHTGAWDSVCFNDFRTPGAVNAGEKLLAALNQNYPHSGGLGIGLTEHIAVIPDTPIVVRADTPSARWPFRPRPRFNVYVRENFDRFDPMLIPCAQGVGTGGLLDAIFELVERYGSGQSAKVPKGEPPMPVSSRGKCLIHKCVECHTEYSEQYGDPLGGIDAGTPFAALPTSWNCPTCDAPQRKFITNLAGDAANLDGLAALPAQK